ncbi:MAG: hypothetical protein Q8M34_02095 [Thermodesulfovibrionales bacterium]|nr:hypothetical protein [Thermodesulfovibrionales bacterium]
MKALMILSFILGLIPELAISYLGMKLLNEGWTVFWIIFFGIQIIHLLRWGYKSLASWILFYFGLKSKLTEDIYSDLVKNKFPNPEKYSHPVLSLDYFNAVAYDPEIDMDTRLVAKEIATTLENCQREGEIQRTIQWEKASETALKNTLAYIFKVRKWDICLQQRLTSAQMENKKPMA